MPVLPYHPRDEGCCDALPSQVITEVDLARGQVRMPGGTKILFGAERTADVPVDLRREPLAASWNPRTGPDKERSGVLWIGKHALQRHVRSGEVLRVCRHDGVIYLR